MFFYIISIIQLLYMYYIKYIFMFIITIEIIIPIRNVTKIMHFGKIAMCF